MLKLSIIGNIGNDATIKGEQGKNFISFSVAVNQSYTNNQGVKVELTEWVNCIINNEKSGLLPYLKKGTKVYVDGKASLNIYQDARRETKYSLNLNVQNCDPFLAPAVKNENGS